MSRTSARITGAPNSPPEINDEVFVAVCLSHFIGRDEWVCQELGCPTFLGSPEAVKDLVGDIRGQPPIHKVVKLILQYVHEVHFFDTYVGPNAAPKGDKEGPDNRNDLLGKMRLALKELIEDRYFWVESDGTNKEGKQTGSEESGGFSRGPLRPLAPRDRERALVAATAYLLRAYCSFWTAQSVLGKEYNCGKGALNDFAQAYYLTERLAISIYEESILKADIDGVAKPEHFVKGELSENKGSTPFRRSILSRRYEYCIWWLHILIDILRAGLYDKLHDYTTAHQCYVKALKTFDDGTKPLRKIKKMGELGNAPEELTGTQDYLRSFACKTIAKARRQLGRANQSLGRFPEALQCYLHSLKDIVLLDRVVSNDDDWDEVVGSCTKLQRITSCLEVASKGPIIDKAFMRSFFETKAARDAFVRRSLEDGRFKKLLEPEQELNKKLKHDVVFSPRDLTVQDGGKTRLLVKSGNRHLAFRSMWSIGRILRIFSEHVSVLHSTARDEDWREWNEQLRERAEMYYQPFIDGKFLEKYKWRTPKLGGAFAQYTYNVFKEKNKELKDSDGELKIAATSLGAVSADGINERVMIPRKIGSFLMRRGYVERVKEIDQSADTGGMQALNKLVVLRRWQSFNPRVPRPSGERVLGGGFYLRWQGKGIVIDPGFDFIQNFYDEGFSLEDIDAVIITHCHPDHADELTTIITLLHEWNEFWDKMPKSEGPTRGKCLDLFLNESTYRSYESLVYARDTAVRSVQILPSSSWKPEKEGDEVRRGYPITRRLRDRYQMDIEIIPARHPDVVSEDSAIGVKLRLYHKPRSTGDPTIVGFTGDTQFYRNFKLARQFQNCDVLVANLGDMGLKELIQCAGNGFKYENHDEFSLVCDIFKARYDYPKVLDFIKLLAQLDLADINRDLKDLSKEERNAWQRLLSQKATTADIPCIQRAITLLLQAITIKRPEPEHNHLGLEGLYGLFKAMRKKAEDNKKEKLLIISEFPEELGSYRQLIARVLNRLNAKVLTNPGPTADAKLGEENGLPKWPVRCLTGDIGLHVGFHVPIGGTKKPPHRLSIRCYECNQNNELIGRRLNYHPVERINETIVKRTGNAMKYLCTELDHATRPINVPRHFLSYPYADMRTTDY